MFLIKSKTELGTAQCWSTCLASIGSKFNSQHCKKKKKKKWRKKITSIGFSPDCLNPLPSTEAFNRQTSEFSANTLKPCFGWARHLVMIRQSVRKTRAEGRAQRVWMCASGYRSGTDMHGGLRMVTLRRTTPCQGLKCWHYIGERPGIIKKKKHGHDLDQGLNPKNAISIYFFNKLCKICDFKTPNFFHFRKLPWRLTDNAW